jgi:hypothetical protein
MTIVVRETYVNRALTEALPGGGTGEARLDVQPDNRLVVTADFDLLLTKLKVVITIRLTAEAGQVNLTVESLEAGDLDVFGLLGVDPNSLIQSMSGTIQEQIEAGLGEGARVHGIRTDDEHLIITARYVQ